MQNAPRKNQLIDQAKINKREEAVSAWVGKQAPILLASNIAPAQLIRVVMNVHRKSPDIWKCTSESLMAAIVLSCEYGLYPDGRQGAIVPVKNGRTGNYEAQFWPMVWGLKRKARYSLRHEGGVSFQHGMAFHGDEWTDIRGTDPCLIHKPDPKSERTEENLLAGYAIAHIGSSPKPDVVVMYADELAPFKKRALAKSKSHAAWTQYTLDMYEKTVVKQLLKSIGACLTLGDVEGHEEVEVERAFDPDDAHIDVDIEGDVSEPPSEPLPTPAEKPKSKSVAPAASSVAPPSPKQEKPTNPSPAPKQAPAFDLGREDFLPPETPEDALDGGWDDIP